MDTICQAHLSSAPAGTACAEFFIDWIPSSVSETLDDVLLQTLHHALAAEDDRPRADEDPPDVERRVERM